MITTFYGVLHSAAGEIASGRMDPDDAARCIAATLLAAFTSPGDPVPQLDSADSAG